MLGLRRMGLAVVLVVLAVGWKGEGVQGLSSIGAMTITDKHNIIHQFGFVQNGSVSISASVWPKNANLRLYLCSEDEQADLMDKSQESKVCSSNSQYGSVPICKFTRTLPPNGNLVVRYNISGYGQHYVNLINCVESSTLYVNWSATLVNPAAELVNPTAVSHLDAAFRPAVPLFHAAGMLWAVAAVGYLLTLRKHWKRATLLLKIIASYSIAKIIFAYFAAKFYSHYSEHGFAVTSDWGFYWAFSIGLKTVLVVALLLLAFTTTLESSPKLQQFYFIVLLPAGLLVVSTFLSATQVSQVSMLVLWMAQIGLSVLILAQVLTGVTGGLERTRATLRAVIRRNTLVTRRRLRHRRAVVRANSASSNNAGNSNTTDSTSNTDATSTSTDTTHNNINSNELESIGNNSNHHSSSQYLSGESSSANEPVAPQRPDADFLTEEQISALNSSIAYLLPYIWFTRYNLFVSFKFVLIFWIFLQIVLFFVNIVVGPSPLHWVNLMTSELLDFIVYAGITYTFLMTARYPFSDSITQGSGNGQGNQAGSRGALGRARGAGEPAPVRGEGGGATVPQLYVPFLSDLAEFHADVDAAADGFLDDEDPEQEEDLRLDGPSSATAPPGSAIAINEAVQEGEEEEEEEELVGRNSHTR